MQKESMKRSKMAFYNSFLKLMKSHRFEEISIQAILDDSGYSRSSFYMNFEDKMDMLHNLLQDEAHAYIEKCVLALSNAGDSTDKHEKYYEVACAAFSFIYEKRDFYIQLLQGRFTGYNKERFFEIANSYYLEKASYPMAEHNPKVNMNLYIAGTTSLFAAFITFWAKNAFENSSEYMAEQLLLFLNNVAEADFMKIKE